jgi:serine/threonine-protein phosphatase PP1 catalytic subunit
MLKEVVQDVYDILLPHDRLPEGATVTLDFKDLIEICGFAHSALLSDPILLELSSPVVIIGDIHGQFTDLLRYLKLIGHFGTRQYLFLGDYVDRGYNSVEVITFLFCAKILYPRTVFLLRGNHETRDMSAIHGFKADCENRFGETEGTAFWVTFNSVFDHLPLAAVVGKKIFCVHGGISEKIPNIEGLKEIERPLELAESDPVLDLLWADPSKSQLKFAPSERGIGSTFGIEAAQDFLCENRLDLIVRAHELVNAGYEFPFEPDKSVVTVFSCPNYAYECWNDGAALIIDEELKCSWEVLKCREPYGYFWKG